MNQVAIIFFLFLVLISCGKDEECDVGYTGSRCNTEITPVSVMIESITVSKFPPYYNGSNPWDPFSDGPDIYLKIFNPNSILLFETDYVEDVLPGTSVSFTSLNILASRPTVAHEIQLYDYDGPNSFDYMGGFGFLPYYKDLGFPEQVTVNYEDISIILTVTYNFN